MRWDHIKREALERHPDTPRKRRELNCSTIPRSLHSLIPGDSWAAVGRWGQGSSWPQTRNSSLKKSWGRKSGEGGGREDADKAKEQSAGVVGVFHVQLIRTSASFWFCRQPKTTNVFVRFTQFFRNFPQNFQAHFVPEKKPSDQTIKGFFFPLFWN